MKYRDEWKAIEVKFDKLYTMESTGFIVPSLNTFCLGDILIIQKWDDYAKGLGDLSANLFADEPIIYEDIYGIGYENRHSYKKIYQK